MWNYNWLFFFQQEVTITGNVVKTGSGFSHDKQVRWPRTEKQRSSYAAIAQWLTEYSRLLWKQSCTTDDTSNTGVISGFKLFFCGFHLFIFITVRQQSCTKVMFPVVSVCPQGVGVEFHVTITWNVLDLTIQGPYLYSSPSPNTGSQRGDPQ